MSDPTSKPTRRPNTARAGLPTVRAPTRKQALLAGAAALRTLQRRYAPEALMFEKGIETPYHARMYRLYQRARQHADLLLALSKLEPT